MKVPILPKEVYQTLILTYKSSHYDTDQLIKLGIDRYTRGTNQSA